MPTRHEALFAEYVRELRQAKTAAEEWWVKLLESETQQVRNRQNAVAILKRRWPIGPVAHPYVIAVIRKFFLACEALNEELADSDNEEEVYPHVFVSEWLLDEESEDLADFVSDLSYWPIGLDEDGDFT